MRRTASPRHRDAARDSEVELAAVTLVVPDAGLLQAALQVQLLLDQGVGDHNLVLIQEIGTGAESLPAVADDGGGLAVPRTVAEFLERSVHAVVLRRVDAEHPPSERREYVFEVRHREYHAAGDIQLPVVLIDQDAEVIQLLGGREHDRFPDGSFLEFAVAGQCVGIEFRAGATRQREALGHAKVPAPWVRSQSGSRGARDPDGR